MSINHRLAQLVEKLQARYPKAVFRNIQPAGSYGSDCYNFASAQSEVPLINGLPPGNYSLIWHYHGYPGNLTLWDERHSGWNVGETELPIGAHVRLPEGGDEFVLFTIKDTVDTLTALFLRKGVAAEEARAIASDIIGFYSELREQLQER